MFVRRVAPVLALVALCTACGPTPKRLTADEYYIEGKAAFDEGNYEGTLRAYKELIDQYPFDPRAEQAEIAIAESHYKKGHYAEAIAAFNDFQRMHPMSPELPKAYYLLGKSFQKQMTTIDRDQGAADNAQGWYRVVVDRYPDNAYAPKARRRMAVCRESMAQHERYVVNFYIHLDNLKAAANRVKGLLEKFPDTVGTNEALEDLAAAYERRGDTAAAEKVRAAANERIAIFASMPESGPGSRAEGAVPSARTPAADALLAELVATYGPGDASGIVVAAPALIDPVAGPKLPNGAEGGGSPGSRGGPGSSSSGGGAALNY